VHKFAGESGRPIPTLHPEFIRGLQAHSWPGNVREFSNFMRRLVTLNETDEIGPESLKTELSGAIYSNSLPAASPAASLRAGTSMREVERHLLEATLQSTGGNRTRTAEILGVSLRTIRNKIREHGLPPRRFA
jgi:DNA-binding NtrC family response regulator